jgi:hypothetical protein
VNIPQKSKNKENPYEQQIFETLNRQIHQFDEPPLSGHCFSKEKHTGNHNKRKPQNFAIKVKLKNGKIINGTCVSFDKPKAPKCKLFFFTGQQKSEGGLKEFCIPSHVDIRSQGGEIALVKDLNSFMEDVYKQARTDFPEWLEKWGCRANETNPLLNLDEIREEWKYKKNQFGIFRLAAQAGFFTDRQPLNAVFLKVAGIEISGTQ